MGYFQDDGTIASNAIKVASLQSGKPYIWGAAGPDTFDCSGLVHYAYAVAGLPGAGRPTSHLWNTASIRYMGDAVSPGSEQPGDLVMPHPGHVGICIGGGQMWNAPQTGIPVRIDRYSSVYAIRRISTPTTNVGTGGVVTTGIETASGPIEAVQSLIDAIKSFDAALKWLADGHNWVRIFEVVGGATLLYIGAKLDG